MSAATKSRSVVHFFSGDDRFCGTRISPRQFTTDENAVTCRACQSLDRLELSEQGKAYVATLNAVRS